MSHWTSGLPKLDIQPFDPTPLYQAVEQTHREHEQSTARRRGRLRPLLFAVGAAGIAGAVMVALALFG